MGRSLFDAHPEGVTRRPSQVHPGHCRKRHNLVANFGPRFALDVFKCNLYNNFSVDRFIDDSHNTD